MITKRERKLYEMTDKKKQWFGHVYCRVARMWILPGSCEHETLDEHGYCEFRDEDGCLSTCDRYERFYDREA